MIVTASYCYCAEDGAEIGISNSKTEPLTSDLTSLSFPPHLATRLEEMASPNPIPPCFVVKKGSKMRS